MGQKNRQKSPKWQKTPIGPWRHVAKPDKAGRSVVTSMYIFVQNQQDKYAGKFVSKYVWTYYGIL